jgi:glucose/arabinose dehydrogenase
MCKFFRHTFHGYPRYLGTRCVLEQVLRIGEQPTCLPRSASADGANQSTFASGTRNPTALAFHPASGDLYAVVQERDGLGDRLVPDYLIRVQQGAFYGWPYAYVGQHPQPGFAQLRPDKVKTSVQPDLLFEAHSSTMDLVFYDVSNSLRSTAATHLSR